MTEFKADFDSLHPQAQSGKERQFKGLPLSKRKQLMVAGIESYGTHGFFRDGQGHLPAGQTHRALFL